MRNTMFQADKVSPLRVLGISSKAQYLKTNLYRIVVSAVLERDGGRCQFLTCQNRREKPATVVAIHHRTLAAYLGIGPSHWASVCSDCAALDLRPESMLFALSGIRSPKGWSKKDIGRWYAARFKDNQETARAIFAKLGEKNQRFIERLIEKGLLANFYAGYLGLEIAEIANV